VPKSSLVNRSLDSGPGSVEARMGSTISFTIFAPATLMLGHSWAMMSLRKPM
jgi:hypothetical protein